MNRDDDPCRVMDPAGSSDAPRLHAAIAAQLDGMARLGGLSGAATKRVRAIFDCLTGQSLDQPTRGPYGGLSRINADGLPFQWVQRLTHDGDEWGFLCEVGRPHTAGTTRRTQTLEAIGHACAIAGFAAPRFLDAVAESLCPVAPDAWPAHWRSAAWVGVGIKGEAVQLKPYFNLNHGSARDRWLRVGWLLQASGRNRALARLCQLSSTCSEGYWPAGLALDIRPDGEPGRMKIYFRSEATTPTTLARWYRAAGLEFATESVRTLLDTLGQTGTDHYPPGALVVSLEIHADETLSIKTDLAVTRWMASDEDIVDGTEVLAQRLGLPMQDLRSRLHACGVPVLDDASCAASRFVGLGCEPDGSSHLNFYHAPGIGPSAASSKRADLDGHSIMPARMTSRDDVHRALELGLDALFAARVDHHWEDFHLPVGRSDQWVTAYVLTQLRQLDARRPLTDTQDAAVHAALDWLEDVRAPRGGWGYNGATPNDADSTAWSMLALHGWGRTVPPEALAFLQSCIVEDGVSTYPPALAERPAWALACADVTAVAARALRACGFNRTLAALAHDEILPRAYWWATPLYASAMTHEDFSPAPAGLAPGSLPAPLQGFRPHGAFEWALLLGLENRHAASSLATTARLLALQGTAGLWPGSARMRLALTDTPTPWREIDSGPLHCDDHGVFTTATALAALAGAVRQARSATRR